MKHLRHTYVYGNYACHTHMILLAVSAPYVAAPNRPMDPYTPQATPAILQEAPKQRKNNKQRQGPGSSTQSTCVGKFNTGPSMPSIGTNTPPPT
eukprot:661816-Pelagomonas_calceolata.AAC.1